MKSRRYVIFFAAVAALGGFLFGYDTAVINGAIGPLSDDFNFTPSEKGFATGSALIGCVIGSALSGLIAGYLGRKRALLVSAGLFFLSAIGSAIPETLGQFVAARILGGFGVGLASMTAPAYISELSPSDSRGRMVSYYQLAIVIGISVVFFVNYWIASIGDQKWIDAVGWRYMLGSETIPAIIFFAAVFTIPNSPRWLAMKNRYDEAESILKKIRDKIDVSEELNEIKKSMLRERNSNEGSLLEKGIPKIVIIGVLLSCFQQVTGINVIMYYGSEVFKSMGASGSAALLETSIVGAVNLIFTIVAILTVDRFGRKPLLMIGSAGMFVGITSLSFLIYFKDFGEIALIAVLIFIASFAMSHGPVVWVLISEIFPNRIRNKAMPIAVASQWIFNYTVTQTFPILSDTPALKAATGGALPFWIYGFMCLVTIIFVWKFVPETKGRTLEDLEKVFGVKRSG